MASRRAAASIPCGWNSFATIADADHEVIADALAHRREHLPGEAGASREVAAVAVGAGVVEGREELVQQVPVGDVDLDAVEPALLCDLGRQPPTRR